MLVIPKHINIRFETKKAGINPSFIFYIQKYIFLQYKIIFKLLTSGFAVIQYIVHTKFLGEHYGYFKKCIGSFKKKIFD